MVKKILAIALASVSLSFAGNVYVLPLSTQGKLEKYEKEELKWLKEHNRNVKIISVRDLMQIKLTPEDILVVTGHNTLSYMPPLKGKAKWIILDTCFGNMLLNNLWGHFKFVIFSPTEIYNYGLGYLFKTDLQSLTPEKAIEILREAYRDLPQPPVYILREYDVFPQANTEKYLSLLVQISQQNPNIVLPFDTFNWNPAQMFGNSASVEENQELLKLKKKVEELSKQVQQYLEQMKKMMEKEKEKFEKYHRYIPDNQTENLSY